jgi:hypothetical protein
MNVLERLRRWWKPAEYDDEHPASEGEGHPLSASERDEEKAPTFADETAVVLEPIDPDDELRR